MAVDDVDVASQALNRLGEPAISAMDETTDTATKVNQLYEPMVLSLLGRYEWTFASARVALSIDGAVSPANEWTYGYSMPTVRTDRVGMPLRVYNSAGLNAPEFFEFEIEGNHILTNATTLLIEYTNRKNENVWPGYFEELVVEAVAARLALPVTENQGKEKHHREIAFGTPSEGGEGGLMGIAMSADSRGSPTRGLLDASDPIAEARFGGGGRDGRW